jgi:hypothetical protein
MASTEPGTAPAARSQEDLVRDDLARAVRLVDALADGDAGLAEALAIESELLCRLVDLDFAADGDGDGC